MPRPNRATFSVGRPRLAVIESLENRQLLSAVSTQLDKEIANVARETGLAQKAAAHAALVHAAAARNAAKLLRLKAHQDLLPGNILRPVSHSTLVRRRVAKGTPAASDSPAVGTFSPAQVRTAYGVSLLPSSDQGQGVTVAIVDVFVDPNITSDVAAFSTQYGLPQFDGVGGDPTLTINNGQGAANSPNDASNNDTSTETALDVEWVHAIAPYANILLVWAKSFAYADLLNAVQTAAATPGVVAVSTSYGGTEFSGETSNESFFTTPTGSNTRAVAFDFSSGDSGYPGFPATSPSVLAVGGTALFTSSTRGKYSFETAWGGVSNDGAGGGGVSTQYATPTFQSNNGVSFGHRSIPDISAIADPITGVSVYNSWDFAVDGNHSWIGVGGTSLATPVVSGMIAEAQQNRILASLPTLSSPQINARLYAAYNSAAYLTDFNDVTIGNNNDVGTSTASFSATTGYDLATGIGSPKSVAFISLLST